MNQSRSDQSDPFDLEQTGDSKYLIFRLGREVYGTPLLGVREVLEPQPPKPLPNTAKHFMGLINMRGQIMGVIDLRIRFDYPISQGETTAYLVFETETGPIAAIVDHVEAVANIELKDMENKPNIRSQVPIDFLIGATVHNNQLITLIDLNKTLSLEDYVEIKNAKLATAG
jgi:purine-binding chemotaxis protein CheW